MPIPNFNNVLNVLRNGHTFNAIDHCGCVDFQLVHSWAWVNVKP